MIQPLNLYRGMVSEDGRSAWRKIPEAHWFPFEYETRKGNSHLSCK